LPPPASASLTRPRQASADLRCPYPASCCRGAAMPSLTESSMRAPGKNASYSAVETRAADAESQSDVLHPGREETLLREQPLSHSQNAVTGLSVW
jgi:hypothetical protein